MHHTTTLLPDGSLTIDRIAPGRRPPGPAAGYQTWRDLTFLHWRMPPERVAPLLPRGLTLDTFDGAAWIGLVPFHMSRVRPTRWLPALPGCSAFPEVNVRTYVVDASGRPGVWFFSLEAAKWLPVVVARAGWGLPYHWARMEVARASDRIRYRSRRRDGSGADLHCDVELGPPRNSAAGDPASLDHFLVERYYLFSAAADGRLWQGQVHHPAYPLREARLVELDERLLAAAGLAPHEAPGHCLYSPGVNVEVFTLQRV